MYAQSPIVRDLMATASDIAGFDVYKVLSEGAEDELQRTDRTQILITVVSLSAWKLLKSHGIESDAVAGFSLGEYSALVDAEVLSIEDAIDLVSQRGSIMEECSRLLDSETGDPGMLAVLGVDYPDLEQMLEQEKIPDAFCSIYNSPVQTVVSATATGIAALRKTLEGRKGIRAIPLKVSGPFHCPLMQEARDRYWEALRAKHFASPKKPVYSNVDGKQHSDGDRIRELCAEQLVSTVLWLPEEKSLLADGYSHLYEVGPGKVLGGLWNVLAKHHEEAATVIFRQAGTVEAIETLLKEHADVIEG